MLPDTGTIQPWLGRSFHCSCGQNHEITIKHILVEEQALMNIAQYCIKADYRSVMLVADKNTYAAAGALVKKQLQLSGVKADVCLLEETGEESGESGGECGGESETHSSGVVADERTIIKVLLKLHQHHQAILAIGAGTIHDIARFVCAKAGRAFISVPTAPSVDGFASVGAPLLIDGFKQTISACAPEAIFADLNVLAASPKAMIAAGFGDMLGKFTSLADWELGHLLLGEHYCSVAADMTRRALQLCVDRVDDIGLIWTTGGDNENIDETRIRGARILTEALILSGLSMLLVGNSRPASGAEHHLSHYWEMRYIEQNRRALLHGAKVGAAAVLASGMYERAAALTREEAALRLNSGRRPTVQDDRAIILQAYGAIAGQVLQENFPAASPAAIAASGLPERVSAAPGNPSPAELCDRWEGVLAIARRVPSPERLTALLRAVGGPATPGELGLAPELVEESLSSSLFVRNRFTIMRLLRWL